MRLFQFTIDFMKEYFILLTSQYVAFVLTVFTIIDISKSYSVPALIFCIIIILILNIILFSRDKFKYLFNTDLIIRENYFVNEFIENLNGDVSANNSVEIIMQGSKQPINKIEDALEFTGHTPEIKNDRILKSNVNGMSLLPIKTNLIKNFKKKDNNITNILKFELQFSQPLLNKGDSVVYQFTISSQNQAEEAFSTGTMSGLLINYFTKRAKLVVRAAKGLHFELLESYACKYSLSARKISYKKLGQRSPEVSLDQSSIEMELIYPRKNYLFIFKYKIIDER